MFVIMSLFPSSLEANQDQWEARIRAGVEAHRQGNFRAAEDAFRAALDEASLTRDDVRVIQTLNWLGQAVQHQGRLVEAQAVFRQALSTAERRYGAADPKVLGPLTRLALFFFRSGRYGEARTVYERARLIASAAPRVDDRLVDTFLGVLAQMNLFQGEYREAETAFRHRLAEQDRGADTQSLRRLESLLGLEWALRALARAQEATAVRERAADLLQRYGKDWEPTVRETVAAQAKVLGDAHPSRGLTLQVLAAVVEAAGRDDEAASYQEQAIRLFNDGGLGESLWVAACLEQYARLLQKRGLDSAARLPSARAAAIRAGHNPKR